MEDLVNKILTLVWLNDSTFNNMLFIYQVQMKYNN